LQIESDSDGLCIRQRHASYRFGKAVQLQSVIIDSVEHLAGPFAITLDGATMTPYADEPPVRLQAPSSTLSARFAVRGAYPDLRPAQVGGMTEVEVSHGKTWVEVRHAVTNPQPNSSLVFRVPLSVPVQAQSCDFGIGNGLYGILESGSAERMVLEVDLPHANTARYRVRTQLASGELRMDYAGELTKAVDLDSRLWIHWREPAKALSLAIKRIAKGCERLTVRLGADGVAETEFLLGRTTVDPAEFEVCYHFMAADLGLAESACPASMLLPPRVSVRRNGPAGPV
jgi:hypothetical protein